MGYRVCPRCGTGSALDPCPICASQPSSPPGLVDVRASGDGFLARYRLPDGRELGVLPLAFGCARLGIGPSGRETFDDIWDYQTPAAAIAALHAWASAGAPPGTEPAGWIRHPASGRRRPDGDPDQEYVRP